MTYYRRKLSATVLSAAAALTAGVAWGADAADEGQAASSGSLEEITVTARRREENLQSVPDSITAFTAATIVNSGIKTIADLAQLTPSLNFRDGRAFAAGFYDLRMRGIGQGQQGWPGVAFIVDGVPTDSPDALTSGSLEDVERIEVLRGPQSALYGAGAIAGAINIITKRPTDELHAQSRLFYGNGDDLQGAAAVSGPLLPGKVTGRLAVNYTNDDGRINSASNGAHLDPTDNKQVDGRLIFDPTDNFEADLRATYQKESVGYTFQDRLPSIAYLNDYDPSFDTRRRTPGTQDRTFGRLAARLEWNLGPVSLTSVSAYSHTRQVGFGSGCYDDVDDPRFGLPTGGVMCLSNLTAYGVTAQPGQNIEIFQKSIDNYDTYSQDLRAASAADSTIQWLLGASGMRRRALNGFGTERSIAGQTGDTIISQRADGKLDKWWGLYGQAGTRVGSWEFTAEARYDKQKYENTTYADASKQVIVPVSGPTGALIDTQEQSANSFQPKGQISYHFDPDHMAYATVSKGFRAGYFNSGSYAAPEHTVNYEGGLKTQWLDNKLLLNAAGFHIDYSDQQLSTNLIVPPYRVPVTVPKTRINGAELESAYRMFGVFTLSGNLAYLQAKIADGTQSPKSPHWSGAVSGQLTQPLVQDWVLNAHADVSFHSLEYLYLKNTQGIPGNKFVNARVGLERGIWGFYLVGRNLTDTREDEQTSSINPVYATRYQNEPRSYGIEVRVDY